MVGTPIPSRKAPLKTEIAYHPDGERTMRSGAAIELSEDELSDEDFKPFDHLHIEGFMIHNPKVLENHFS